MRVYDLRTGWLYEDTPTGLRPLAKGNSGYEGAMNDPLRQGEKGVGPLPAGAYEISDPYDDLKLGPHVMRLTPLGKTDVLGRDGSTFRIHGFGQLGPAQSSHGCLLFGLVDRRRISAGSRLLVALSDLTHFATGGAIV